MGPLWKQTSISTALLSIPFGVPSKGPPLPGSLHRAPSERDAPFLEPSFIHHSTSPVYEPPSRFLSGAPMERDARLQSLFYIFSRVPSNEVLPPGSPHKALIGRERCSVSRALLQPSLSVPGERTSPHGSQRGPYGERCPSPELPSTHKSTADEPPARLPIGETFSSPEPSSPYPFL